MTGYNNTNAETFEKFAEGIDGVENHSRTLETNELPDGSVELVSYGWQRLALLEDGEITVFEGWADWANEMSDDAETTPRHIRNLRDFADNISSATPQVAARPDSVAEVGHMNFAERL